MPLNLGTGNLSKGYLGSTELAQAYLGTNALLATSTAFVPTDISGCLVWFDADDASTISEAAGSVSQWDDKSGNGYHLKQATGSRQPRTGIETLNSKNMIYGADGQDMSIDQLASIINQPATMLIIGRVFSGGGGNARLTARDWQIRRDGNNIAVHAGSRSPTSQTYLDFDGDVMLWEINGSNHFVWTNGVQVFTGNAGNGGFQNMTLFAQSNTGSNSADFACAELVIWTKLLTTAEKNQAGNALAAKWGATWTDIT
jgi:hypothetical protein